MTILFFGVNPVVGKTKALDFALVDINGNSFTLSKCSAKLVLIDFFATWCDPCKAAIPTFRSLYNEYSRDQLEIISISPEGEDTLRSFAQRADINMIWIVASDPAGSVSGDYLGLDTRIPHIFLVDANRYIDYDHLGWSGDTDASKLRSKIGSLLSGTSNGDSNGNSDTVSSGPPFELIAIIGGVVVVFLVGIVVAGQKLGWSKPAKKRRRSKR